MFFLLLRAGIAEALQRVQAAQARELLPTNEPAPFVARDDGHGMSLKRLKPYHELGTGKGNRAKRSAKSLQENSEPLAQPFSRPPAASKPRTMMEQLEACKSRQARYKPTPLQAICSNAHKAPPHVSLGPGQPANPSPTGQVHAFPPAANLVSSFPMSLQLCTSVPASSSTARVSPGANNEQSQLVQPTFALQPQSLQPTATPFGAIFKPLDSQARVQAGAPMVGQAASASRSIQAQAMAVPASYHHPLVQSFMQVPFQIPGWGLFNQLAPPTHHNNHQAVQQLQQQATATALKISDCNFLPQQATPVAGRVLITHTCC